jgi:hypothetical protein
VPAGNGVRITVFLAVVNVGSTIIPEVTFRTFHTVADATLLLGLFGFVLPVIDRRRTIVLLRERALFASK